MAKPISAMPGDVRKRVQAMGKAIETDRRRIVLDAAKVARRYQEREISQDTGGDMRLSGVGKRRGRAGGRKVSVGINLIGQTAELQARGPLPLIDRDTKPHVIRSAYGKRSTAPNAVLRIPGIGYRRSVVHPGTKGKATWRRGREPALREAGKVLANESTKTLTKAFRAGLG